MSQTAASISPSSELQLSTVPTLLRYLRQLDGLLDLAQSHCRSKGLDENRLLGSRIAPDMQPLRSQVWICGNFVPRMEAALRGGEPRYPDWPQDLAGMQHQLQALLDQVQAWSAGDFEPADRRVESDAGQAWLQMPLRAWIHQFALPNFCFHLTAVYLLLRQQGLPLGKAQYDGFHRY
ncbi:DUF1993 domain-containing protein [Mitsuaria sp. WAJ17]|uniref:DUF1993 domain-containing protein n=1 Tax=Mitsuaria sp. WAJ17 TaxID=2761452 RepID=UPI0015FF668E|nr:DUF1993 domain-containing protein [Mitsuaria sp. WAJ17]MBB2485508.1 DUF1993 domain-containing protein [Mitsuaria sp. WAJ17]